MSNCTAWHRNQIMVKEWGRGNVLKSACSCKSPYHKHSASSSEVICSAGSNGDVSSCLNSALKRHTSVVLSCKGINMQDFQHNACLSDELKGQRELAITSSCSLSYAKFNLMHMQCNVCCGEICNEKEKKKHST